MLDYVRDSGGLIPSMGFVPGQLVPLDQAVAAEELPSRRQPCAASFVAAGALMLAAARPRVPGGS